MGISMGSERGRNSVRDKKGLFVIAGLGVVCIFLSIYLTYDHIKDEDASFCDVGSHISCSRVRRSVFSEILNVPIAVFGLSFNIVTVLGALLGIQLPPRQATLYIAALFFWNIIGVIFVFYLVAAEIYLGALCPFCTVVHICQLVSMWIIYKIYTRQQSQPGLMTVLWEMKGWLVLIVCLNSVPLVFFNSSLLGVSGLPGNENPISNEKFSECITHSGWRFYGKSGCGWCNKQKELFGGTLNRIVFLDCAEDAKESCDQLEVNAFPTWIQFDDDGKEINRMKGYVSAETWEVVTECQFPYKAPRVI